MNTSNIVYPTRFCKKDLALALDSKYKTNLVSPSGQVYSLSMRKYFFQYEKMINDLGWSLDDYKKWRGNIDPFKAKIICSHLSLTVENF